MNKKIVSKIISGIIAVVLIFGMFGTVFLVIFSSFQNERQDQNIDTSQISIQSSSMSKELIIEDIEVGTGTEVKAGDVATFHYTGTLEDGTKFDSSLDRGQPFTIQIGVGQVIAGWDQGIPGMKVGGKRKLTIPGDLAYGPSGIPQAGIGPNATLIFEVELLEVQ